MALPAIAANENDGLDVVDPTGTNGSIPPSPISSQPQSSLHTANVSPCKPTIASPPVGFPPHKLLPPSSPTSPTSWTAHIDGAGVRSDISSLILRNAVHVAITTPENGTHNSIAVVYSPDDSDAVSDTATVRPLSSSSSLTSTSCIPGPPELPSRELDPVDFPPLMSSVALKQATADVGLAVKLRTRVSEVESLRNDTQLRGNRFDQLSRELDHVNNELGTNSRTIQRWEEVSQMFRERVRECVKRQIECGEGEVNSILDPRNTLLYSLGRVSQDRVNCERMMKRNREAREKLLQAATDTMKQMTILRAEVLDGMEKLERFPEEVLNMLDDN